jgi:hypothetical protein
VTADVHGPIDFLLLEFPSDLANGEAADALLDLVEEGIVRIYDLVVIRKEADGSFSGLEITDLSKDEIGGFAMFAGAQSGMLSEDDIQEAGEVMHAGTTAALVVYENSWAIPFVAAALKADAHVISTARIPAAVVNEVLENLEALED